MENDKPKTIEIATRVSKAELEAHKTVNQLLKSGVKNLVFNSEKLEITATREDRGVIRTEILRFGDICNQMELTQIDTNNKDARNNNIVKMYQQGYSQSDIARMHGISQTRVHNILKDAGVL